MNSGSEPKAVLACNDLFARYKGDQAALLAALYDEYAATILGFLERFTRDRQDAENLLMAVFLELPAALSRFDADKRRLGAWLIQHARRVAVSAMNAAKVPTNGSIRNEPKNVSEPNAISQQALTPQVDKAVSVLDLVYTKGYTFAATAGYLGKTEEDVKSALRTELKKYRTSRSATNKLNPDA